MNSKTNDRRGFLHGMLAAGSLAAAAPAAAQAQAGERAPRRHAVPAVLRARAELQVPEAIELRQDRRQQRSLADRAGRRAGESSTPPVRA